MRRWLSTTWALSNSQGRTAVGRDVKEPDGKAEDSYLGKLVYNMVGSEFLLWDQVRREVRALSSGDHLFTLC